MILCVAIKILICREVIRCLLACHNEFQKDVSPSTKYEGKGLDFNGLDFNGLQLSA